MRILAILLALVLAACAAVERAMPDALRPSPPTRERVVQTPSANELVAYMARLRGMNERALAAETARQREMARAQPGDLPQIKIAIALSLSSLTEESDVISLVDPIVRRDARRDGEPLHAASCVSLLRRGKRMRKCAPGPSSTSMRPRCRVMYSFTIESPRPLPLIAATGVSAPR